MFLGVKSMSENLKGIIAIMIYRLAVILAVLVFAHFNGMNYLWLLLLLLTSFSLSDKREIEEV